MQTKKFKFFRGEGKSSEHYDSQLTAHTINYISMFATSSMNEPNFHSNNEMERWYEEHPYERNHLEVEDRVKLFQATTTITVNPTLWTKVKIFGTQVKLFFKECWQHEPIGLIFVTILFCLVSFIGIMKLFGA